MNRKRIVAVVIVTGGILSFIFAPAVPVTWSFSNDFVGVTYCGPPNGGSCYPPLRLTANVSEIVSLSYHFFGCGMFYDFTATSHLNRTISNTVWDGAFQNTSGGNGWNCGPTYGHQ